MRTPTAPEISKKSMKYAHRAGRLTNFAYALFCSAATKKSLAAARVPDFHLPGPQTCGLNIPDTGAEPAGSQGKKVRI